MKAGRLTIGAASVERIVEWAREGPPSARVTHIDIEDGTGNYAHFEQRPTA